MSENGKDTDQRSFADQLITQKVRALYLQAPVSNLTVLAIAVLFFLLLNGRLDAGLLGAWTLLMIAAASGRLLLLFWYRMAESERSDRFWLQMYTVGSLLVGISWGLIQLLLQDLSDVVVVVALLMLLFGVLSSAVAVLAAHMPAFIGYTFPQVAMLAWALLAQDDPTMPALATALFFYIIMLTIFARNTNQQFAKAQRLGSENELLVEQLHIQNVQREDIITQRTIALENTNARLEREIGEREQAEEALHKQQKSLQQMAHHDALTGLPNRLLLADRLAQSIAKSDRNPTLHAVLFIDLDHFKQINDSLGHSVGDELLKAVSSRLLSCVRKEDTVARLGGDEFILLAENLEDADAIRKLAEKILASFNTPFEVGRRSLSVAASIGISIHPTDGDDTESLLRNADSAMYSAKNDGRNAYRFYSREMTELAIRRMAIETELHQALGEGQLELYYQPQISLDSGAVLGAEALLRWNHPSRGLLMPAEFIPIAEESTLINRLGIWVLHQACRQMRKWHDAGVSDFRLGINLSGRELWNNALLDKVDDALRQSGCAAELLELEITESFLVQQPEQTRQLLQELRNRGVSVAVDDFGTGYSSLSYLKQYPVSKLKIDQSFVRDIPVDIDDQAIVRAVIALGRSLDLTVIAEGVETETQAEFLKREGCHQAQGYLYAKPMPATQFEEFMGLLEKGANV